MEEKSWLIKRLVGVLEMAEIAEVNEEVSKNLVDRL
jgi:hypothetical protein